MPVYFRLVFVTIFVSICGSLYGQNNKGTISGKLWLDNSWSSTIYLSHIPTFDDMYVMSGEMIIAKTIIDSLGYFKFDIDFLPIDENLFRLHIVKKDDSPATLIIGGKDENHLFFIANRSSKIHLTGKSAYPPFKNVIFENSIENIAFQQITNHFFIADSMASESSASKRSLIENQLEKDLFLMADTSKIFLVSLYAIYKNRFSSNYFLNKDFYTSYVNKWSKQDNAYFNSFKKQLPNRDSGYLTGIIAIVCVMTVIGFVVGKYSLLKTNNIQKLSVQEKKIYKMLQLGASNQEIANELNIGLSTVKSHVSSIYSKLKIKSRKGIMDIK